MCNATVPLYNYSKESLPQSVLFQIFSISLHALRAYGLSIISTIVDVESLEKALAAYGF